MVFYLINVANVVNMSQPGVRIGGGLHALIRIFSRLFTYQVWLLRSVSLCITGMAVKK